MRIYELDDSDDDTVVFVFGRFNPPTRGHEKLLNIAQSVAEAHRTKLYVFPSRSHDTKKNPLGFDEKLEYLRLFFPDYNYVDEESVRNPFQAISWLSNQGFRRIYFVAGADRASNINQEVKKYIRRYNKNVNPEHELDIDYFDTVDAGVRNPDSTDIDGVSGSKARQYAIDNMEGEFVASIAPTSGSDKLRRELFKAVRKGLGVN